MSDGGALVGTLLFFFLLVFILAVFGMFNDIIDHKLRVYENRKSWMRKERSDEETE